MENTTKTALNLGIGFIIIAVTLVVFFVGFSGAEKTTLNWFSLVFVLVAEVALIAGLVVMPLTQPGSSANLIRLGILTTLIIYLAVTIVLGFLSDSVFTGRQNAFISSQVIIIGAVVVIIITLMVSASTIAGKEGQENLSDNILKNSVLKAFSLKNNPDYQEYAPMLDRLSDEFRYIDQHKSLAGLDKDIEAAVLELAEHLANLADEINAEEVEQRTNQIIAMIKERNMRLKQ